MLARFWLEVSTDEEVFVGSLSFVKRKVVLNLVHGSSVDTSETIHIDIFDGELRLEFYTGATSGGIIELGQKLIVAVLQVRTQQSIALSDISRKDS